MNDPRYDLFGWDYPLVNPPSEESTAWHLRHAEETGGPVLELACGTGSLLVSLARAGHEVVGLDLSERMLDVARERLAAEPGEVRERVTLVRGDMADFDLGRVFPLVVIADNSFRELPRREDLVRCLSRIRRHLAPGGRLLLTERRYDPARWPGGSREWPWSEPVTDPRTGDRVRRRISVTVDEAAMRLTGLMTYRVERADGSGETVDCPFESLLLRPEDYPPLFAEAGLSPEPLDAGDSPWLRFVIRPASGP